MLARTCRLAGGATAVTALLLTTTPAGAQSASAGKASAPKAWTQKTPNGQPDLQGTWDYATITDRKSTRLNSSHT